MAVKASRGERVKKTAWVILFLSLLWMVLWMWQQPSSQSQRMAMQSSVAVKSIVQMIIQKHGGKRIVLKLQQGQWRMANGDLAVQDATLRLLDDLTSMQVIRVVTRKYDFDADLGLLKRGVSVQCLDAQGVVLLDVTVGKQGSDLLSTYIRRADSDAVVAVNRTLVWQVKRSKKAWKATEKVEP
ncbi:MAG: DUF4340 domain-containing protein [Mariprofundaceae bacterium]|nr:DUF4340 domain-containing protein [Mariprofundaceae bacterium]